MCGIFLVVFLLVSFFRTHFVLYHALYIFLYFLFSFFLPKFFPHLPFSLCFILLLTLFLYLTFSSSLFFFSFVIHDLSYKLFSSSPSLSLLSVTLLLPLPQLFHYQPTYFHPVPLYHHSLVSFSLLLFSSHFSISVCATICLSLFLFRSYIYFLFHLLFTSNFPSVSHKVKERRQGK